ncbi:MAG: BMP family ABC transporter substrate-binding protein [Ardenticatenaceae bacterium]|nr:BMP family ABC transporter substrate-binding protein [Anaerolineales bacterium]MCB8938536.1 BMP family ABC transporter substrate-binding protein [Ardenticatenaceae bacterium]MCB8973669.1 BMP family ABC transporter substrate-binding protein [Ardenticatenaceae bacterium]
MQKSKFWLLSLLLILAMALVACGGGGDEPAADETDTAAEDASGDTEEMAEEEAPMEEEVAEVETDATDCSSEEVFCIGLVTDVGEVDDKSFNQSAWEGAQSAADALGGPVDYIETSDAKDYGANIALFADAGYDVIVTVGFALGEATAEAALTYPDIDFIGVDQFQAWQFDEDTSNDIPNLAGLIFNEDKAGFLAGALAGMLTETNTIAAVLGTDLVPPVVAFKEGYEAGALYVNPDVTFISTYHPGGLDVAFTDPEWGASTAAQAIGQGADVIFGAGGKTGNGALIEVASNAGLFCIGVDTDQWETVPEAHSCLVSSAMKLITPGVFDLISASKDGSFPAGNFFGGVGLAPFHDFDGAVSDEIKTTLEEIDAGLQDGSISTGYGQ